MSIKAIAVSIAVISLVLSGCTSGQLFGPTLTPTLPPTSTPVPTSTPIPPTPTPILPDISGKVTGKENKSANRFFVLCKVLDSGCESTSLVATSNSDGYFEFQDVPSGEYYIFYDSGHENFFDAVKKWEGKIIQVKDVSWLAENFITLNADGKISFTIIEDTRLDQNTAYMMVYRFFATSPFLWAHTCASGSCSLPENVLPVIASVANGKPAQVEFEVYGPFGELSGEADTQKTAANTPSSSAKNGVPVVKSVDLRRDTSSGGLIIFQDISFQDSDGDVTRVDYEIVSSTISGLQVEGGSVDIPSTTQQTGALISGEWGCGNENYEVTLRVTFTDKLGNLSNPFEYTMICG
jgi:hypothetical protein